MGKGRTINMEITPYQASRRGDAIKLKLFLGGIVSAVFIVWMLTTAVLAQGEEPPPPYAGLQNPFPWTDNATQAAGKEVYLRSCQGCHGAFGKNISLADFSATRYSNNLIQKPDYYFWLISEGRIDRGMPAYKAALSEKQRWQVLTYVWSLGQGAVAESPKPSGPQPEHGVLPDCFRCHTRTLVKGHDALGSGSSACLTCHSSTSMGKLRLFDGTDISQADSPKLCGQCHTGRYDEWQKGTHGTLIRNSGTSGIPANVKPKCADCHDPHQPRISLTTGTALPSVKSSQDAKLDCLSCHVRVLKGHNKLGPGSESCWACHSSTEMTTFHLAGGETRLAMSESTTLCAQCHQARYQAWSEGTHGVPAWREGEPALFGSEKVNCANCHDPHQPQVPLLNITRPHPSDTPPPPPPPTQLLTILGISILALAGVGVAVTRGGSGQ